MKSPFAVEKIRARQVFDSRGVPTVEVEAISGQMMARAIAPAGTSKGRHEAHDLRDEEKAYLGLGVSKAVKNVNGPIARELQGMNACAQQEIDKALIDLDGTPQKNKLGANAMVAVSMAICKLGAQLQDQTVYEHVSQLSQSKEKLYKLPMPLVNVINGGKHAGNQLPVEEILVEPTKAKSVEHALQITQEIYHSLKQILAQKYGPTSVNVGELGGFAVPVNDLNTALDHVMEAAKQLGYEKQIKMGLNVAASHISKKGAYHLGDKALTHRQLINYYANLVAQYPISVLIDPFSEDDIQGFQGAMQRIGSTHPIVGDDLLVSNPMRMKRVMDLKACNGLDLKINQIGTISEAMQAYAMAKEAKWTTLVSARAGESEDSFLADFAVGLHSNYVKFGALSRSERVNKYNQLLRIEETLGKKAIFGK